MNGKGYNNDGFLQYEIISGRGKIKEYYNNGELRFEGKYLNGIIKGKYYLGGKLIFEGEYLNGKKNGKVKEYYDNGKLKFEGEYLDGEKNGKAKEYYDNGELKFEGQYLIHILHFLFGHILFHSI